MPKTKVCKGCGKRKKLAAFYPSKAHKLGCRSQCIACQKESMRQRYLAHAETYKETARSNNFKYRDNYRANRKEWYDELRDKPCADCTHKFPAFCMDFHHVRGKKVGMISVMIYSAARARVVVELAKCVLLCANCHRIRHNK